MKVFNKFIESKTEPSNKNDIWFDGSVFRMYKEGEWRPFTVPIEAAEKIKENLDSLKLFNIVEYLPDVGKDNIIYLLNNKNGSESNSLIEYIYINNKWEEIGSFTPSFDLDGYVKSEDLEKALTDYVKKTDLAKINDKPLYEGGNIEITGGGTSSGKYQSNIEDGSIAMTEDYGDFKVGTTVESLNGKTYDELFDGILFPTVNPTFTALSASIAWKGYSATQEVGATGPTANNFTTGYNAGSINLSGKYQTTRGGEQNIANSFIYVNGNVANKTLPSTVTLGNTTFNYRAAYAQGPQPKDNKGNNFGSPLAAGSVDSGQITLNGTYPWYASTQTAGVLTKQTLIAWNANAGAMQAGTTSAGIILQPHTNEDNAVGDHIYIPQMFELPKKATKLQQLNTSSGKYEEASLGMWEMTESNKIINGNTRTYYTYKYLGGTRDSVTIIINF